MDLNNELISSIMAEDSGKTFDLLQAGADPNTKKNGIPLIILCAQNDNSMIHYLIDHKTDLDAVDPQGNTALHWAAKKKYADKAEALLKGKASHNIVNNDGNTALHLAAVAGEYGIISKMCRMKNKPDVNIKDKNGNIALSLITADPVNMIKDTKILLRLGSNLSSCNIEKNNPLLIFIKFLRENRVSHWGSEGSNGDEFVAYKLENGLFTYWKNHKKASFSLQSQRYCAKESWGPKEHLKYHDALDCCLQIAAEVQNFEQSDSIGNTPLLAACALGEARLINALIKGGSEILAVNNNGETTLMLAAGSGRTDAVQAILKTKNFSINATDKAGWSAVHHLAASGDYTEIAKLILKKNPDLQLTSNTEKDGTVAKAIAHDIAQAKGYEEIAVLLAGNKTEEQVVDIRSAVGNGKKSIVEKYLSAKGDIESADEEGYTLLLLAASTDQTDIVELLVKHGADINAVQNRNFNALMLCINRLFKKGQRISAFESEYRSHVRMAEILINNGINLTVAKSGSSQKALRDAAEISEHITTLIVDKLVADYPDFKKELDHKDSEGFSALHFAARSGNIIAISAIVEAGGNLDLAEDYGFLPLHEAIIAGKFEAAEYLIKKGTNLSHKITQGYDSYATGDDAKAIAEKSHNKDILNLFAKK